MTYKYVFQVEVAPGLEEEFVRHWTGGSAVIQKREGALGTRLHKVRGEKRLYIAIAEWATKEARIAALALIRKPGAIGDEYREWKENDAFGMVTPLLELDEVSSVILSK